MRSFLKKPLVRSTFPVVGAAVGHSLANGWDHVCRPDSLLRNRQQRMRQAGFTAGLLLALPKGA